ncbi:hypothetical protein [Nonomuraea sp. NPDC005650]|uniref:hypothetical protein n=1 Tax=Nonomuraea sp. NPDC005650 TaxID=3157045 RepID=UPI0033B9E176
MQYTPAELVAAWQDAKTSHEQARTLADTLSGEPAACAPLRIAAAAARDAYATWTAAFDDADATREEIRDLGRIVYRYLNSLPDQAIRALAVRFGFPVSTAGYVSASSLRFWLNTAYADDHPRKTHVADVAHERADHDPDAVVARFVVVFTSV